MSPTGPRKPRYRFDEFVLSPAQRQLRRGGSEVRLIPRYFDLLLLLLERRHEAVRRREILDSVWHDVVVSDGALSQAVRTLRRALDDDPRAPRFVRTVARHGYRFSWTEVTEEPDDGMDRGILDDAVEDNQPDDAIDEQLTILLSAEGSDNAEDTCRAAAERLHSLGTERALERLAGRAGHQTARAWLRECRWDLPQAGAVPILGQPGSLRTAGQLILLRLRRLRRLAGARALSAGAGGFAAGALAGLVGAILLLIGPGSTANASILGALPLVGAVIGGLGALGVGAGLALAETVIRSHRPLSLALGGAVGGGIVGALSHGLGALTIEGLLGRQLSAVAGGTEGLVLGAAAGLGYGLATLASDGMAAPRGRRRLRVAGIAAVTCSFSAIALTLSGSYLGAMSLDLLARSFPGSQVSLEPLARLLGEPAPGSVTKAVIGAWEGLMFGFGLILGLTRRPQQLR